MCFKDQFFCTKTRVHDAYNSSKKSKKIKLSFLVAWKNWLVYEY